MSTSAVLQVDLDEIAEMTILPDHVNILTFHPHKCTCGRMTAFFINRDGRTGCAGCYRQPRPTPEKEKNNE